MGRREERRIEGMDAEKPDRFPGPRGEVAAGKDLAPGHRAIVGALRRVAARDEGPQLLEVVAGAAEEVGFDGTVDEVVRRRVELVRRRLEDRVEGLLAEGER